MRSAIQRRRPSTGYSTRRPIRRCGRLPELVSDQSVREQTFNNRAASSTPTSSGSEPLLGFVNSESDSGERVAELCIGILTGKRRIASE